MIRKHKRWCVSTLMLLTLTACGGGSEADPKMSDPEADVGQAKVKGETDTTSRPQTNTDETATENTEATSTNSTSAMISGVVLDGYLSQAKVCFDKNKNARCDKDDGDIAITNEQGQYSLPMSDEMSQYDLVAEAISGVTIDMDTPDTPISQGYILSVPSPAYSVISPLTSMAASLSQSTQRPYAEAVTILANSIDVDPTLLQSDYAAQDTAKSRSLHMLARGITHILQQAQAISIEAGVSQETAREGALSKLVLLDVVAIKKRTDSLSFGADNTQAALDQLAADYQDQLKIMPEDVESEVVFITPPAPQRPQVNDSANTFNWENVLGYPQPEQYEYSVNGGETWSILTTKPLSVSNIDIAAGDVQVRVKADEDHHVRAGGILSSDKKYSFATTPAAPSELTLNDATNQFDWRNVAQFESFTDYEYSVNNGEDWVTVTAKPQLIPDMNIPVGHLKLRLKEDFAQARYAGLSVQSTERMSVTPNTPSAPTITKIDDDADFFSWEWVEGFEHVADYEINLSGSWVTAIANPYQIGNNDYGANQIKVRVKHNPINGRLAGEVTAIAEGFTKNLSKPEAPTLAVVDDANNTFNWTFTPGHPDLTEYEISFDGGQTFIDAKQHPVLLEDAYIAQGHVCVRVKSNSAIDQTVGESLCSDKAYSLTPDAPAAPTQGIVDDLADTFTWEWVPTYRVATDYQYRINAAEWLSVATNPLVLGDEAYVKDSIEVRVKANAIDGRPAGAILSNNMALTVRPSSPNAPYDLIQDDQRNTLDWRFTPDFDEVTDYEYSLNNGAAWQVVTQKPIHVGEVALATGVVLLRVKANALTGMPAGAQAANTQPYTQKPKMAGPTGGVIHNDASYAIATNAFSWDDITTGSTDYNQPEHYEFTTDQGNTWQPVTSKPLYVGRQAYDKSHVGIRLKANAVNQISNDPSEVLWATHLSGEFVAQTYVPMSNASTVAPFTRTGQWNTYKINCVAQYSPDGTGEMVFWARRSSTYPEDIAQTLADEDACELSNWGLVSDTEAKALSLTPENTLPSSVASYVLHDEYDYIWADKNGTPVLVSQGAEVTGASPYSSRYLVPRWQVPATAELITKITANKKELEITVTGLKAKLTESVSFLQNALSTSVVNVADNTRKKAELAKYVNQRGPVKQAFKSRVDQYVSYIDAITNRVSAEEQTFQTLVNEYQALYATFAADLNALTVMSEGMENASALMTIRQAAATISTAKNTLDAATTGDAIYAAYTEFSKALNALKVQYQTSTTVIDSLTLTLNELEESHPVHAVYEQMLTLYTEASNQHDVVQLTQDATDAFNRAVASGYLVSQQDATVSGRWAKMDKTGRYLPSSATYADGWRCVEDIKDSNKKRVWTLLKDGLPDGADDIAYNVPSAGTRSVLGANGLVANTNAQALCGFSDWKVPSLLQLKSLATKATSVTHNLTMDVAAFPHHKAMMPQYDKSQGGYHFYYWSDVVPYDDYVRTLRYESRYSSQEELSLETDGSENKVVLARLVREDIPTFSLLDTTGTVVTDRAFAQCVRTPAGDVWQLFNDAKESHRFATIGTIEAQIRNYKTNTTCGVDRWRLPSKDELRTLMPIDSSIFKYNNVRLTGFAFNFIEGYRDKDATGFDIYLLDMKTGGTKGGYSSNKTLYRLISPSM